MAMKRWRSTAMEMRFGRMRFVRTLRKVCVRHGKRSALDAWRRASLDVAKRRVELRDFSQYGLQLSLKGAVAGFMRASS